MLKKSWSNKTSEEKKEISRKMSEGVKNYYANRTPEQKEEHSRRISEAWANKNN